MTPDQEAKLKRAKDLAARRALETYGRELKDFCKKEGIPVGDLNGDGHIHLALLLGEQGESVPAVVLRAQWTFHSNPVIVAEVMEKAKKEGIG